MNAPSVSPGRQYFRKYERLGSRKIIRELVANGKHIQAYPLALTYLKTGLKDTVLQAAFSVPKRNFKNASDRNKIKRRMREAYRKNKSSLIALVDEKKSQYALLFVYKGNTLPAFSEIEAGFILILQRFAETIQKNNG